MENRKRGRPVGTGGKPNGSRVGSRAWLFENLAIGESTFFVGDEGQKAQPLQASIAATYRGGRNMCGEGLEQVAGICIFEGEQARPVVKVTRVKNPSYE